MSLYKDASLVMIPSAYKDGKLYSIRPTDGSGDFTFSRGSNLAATRVDVNGLIEKGRENLFLNSSNLAASTWEDNAGASTANAATAPDGSNNAIKFVPSSSTTFHYVHQDTPISVTSGGVVCFSIYLKRAGYDYVLLNTSQGSVNGNAGPVIDLINGEVVNNYVYGYDVTIVSAGNDWWRISYYYKTNSTTTNVDFNVLPSSSITAYAGDGASGVFMWGAQLEQGLVATDYIETGASTAQAGILEDMPRLDYSGSCPALLLEPQRTNLIPHSEYLNGWNTISAITIEANTDETLSPEGKYNAYKTTAIGGSTQRIYDVVNVAAGSITMSMYVKSGTEDQIRLMTTDQTFDIYYDLTNETKTEVVGTGNIEPVGNGWYRISATGTSAGGTEVPQVRHLGTAGSSEYQYWYGIQLEAGSYPTSYIPTYGSSVTRSYDNSSLGGLQTSSILNGTKGTLLFEGIKKQDWYFSNFVITTDGSNTNRSLLIDNSGSVIRLRVWNASSSIDATIFTTSLSNGTFKYLIRWDNGNLAVFVNGASVGSATINAYSYTTINLKEGTFSNNLVNQVLTFPTALTDNECIALTTI